MMKKKFGGFKIVRWIVWIDEEEDNRWQWRILPVERVRAERYGH
ncbi:hypothetical protein Hdeb2414_s0032g00712821 [Helianthus debilis subsp. tardiflorus]